MEVQQVKRQKVEPKVKISKSLVKNMLKEAGIKVQNGVVYNFYACGHVFERQNEKSVIKCVRVNKGQYRSQRICPICWENLGKKEPLMTKYKKCASCGTEHVGKKLQESVCCAQCSAGRKALKGEDPFWETHSNGHLADPSRCFCIHKKECIVKYADYEVIPCKGCRRFKEKEGEWY